MAAKDDAGKGRFTLQFTNVLIPKIIQENRLDFNSFTFLSHLSFFSITFITFSQLAYNRSCYYVGRNRAPEEQEQDPIQGYIVIIFIIILPIFLLLLKLNNSHRDDWQYEGQTTDFDSSDIYDPKRKK